MSTRPLECGYCGMDHSSSEECPLMATNAHAHSPENASLLRAHDCDDRCSSCPDCYAASGAEVCSRTCVHAQPDVDSEATRSRQS